MSRNFVQMLRQPAAAAARAIDELGIFFLLGLGVVSAGASLLVGV
jgi:hypothetical protein